MNHLKNINWNGATFGFDLLMINDHQRNRFYRDALGDCQDKIVLDIGSGTGILSVMAVQAGAQHVYSFERDPQNFLSVQGFIRDAGLQDKITVICSDILEVDKHSWPHQSIDIIITETFANDCFIENFAFLVEHVEQGFNLSPDHRWIPDHIELHVGLVDVEPEPEFDPGVPLPEQYAKQIHDAIKIYRDHLYHTHDQINLPVAQIPRLSSQDMALLEKFTVNRNLRHQLSVTKFHLELDHTVYNHPYLKVDWCVRSDHHQLWLNRAGSWRSIAFKIDTAPDRKVFYLRFNPLTNALIASQT